MILNNFGAIIAKRKELKPLFKIFIKQFQQELAFIEETIETDAEEIRKEVNCCHCLFRRINCFRKNTLNRFQMYNPVFSKVFTVMAPEQRQEFFIQLLGFIEELGTAYEECNASSPIIEEFDVAKYKTLITSKLIDKLISKSVIKELENEQKSQMCVDLLVNLEGKEQRKIGRFKNLKLELIEKIQGEQHKIVMNLRNFQIIKSNEQNTIKLMAVYETVYPLEIDLQFTDKYREKQHQKYLKIFVQIIKIGKIEKLIANIDLVKVFGKGYNDQKDKLKVKQNLLMKTLIRQQENNDEMMEKNFVETDDIIKSASIKNDLRLKRIETIKTDHYQEIKKKLIETLLWIAQKKEKKNLKVVQFRQRQPIANPKPKSEEILQVLKSTQAFIPRKTINPQKLESPQEIERDILEYAVQMDKQKYNLSIINQRPQRTKRNIHRQHNCNTNSFIQSDEDMSLTAERFQQIFSHKNLKKTKKIQFQRNIYKKIYPQEYKFSFVESLMEMVKIAIDSYYVFCQQSMIKQSNNLTDDKLAKFKSTWLEKLSKTIKVYCRKQMPNFVKMFIPLAIEIKSLVQAILNVEAYSHWHPNIKKAQIVTIINSENAILYRMEIINPITNKTYHELTFMHLFRLQEKYYIVQKRMEDLNPPNEKKNKGFFDFLNFSKNIENFSKINYSMIRISKNSTTNFCQMDISFDYEPVDKKYVQNARKQLMTFFLNYVFITNYWKLSQSQKMCNSDVFNYDWIISKDSFDHEERSNKKEMEDLNLFDLENLKRLSQISASKENKGESSSQFVHSSEFYQM